MSNKAGRLRLVAILLAVAAVSGVQQIAAEEEGGGRQAPLVAAVWRDIGAEGGKEAVVEPLAEKLKAAGITRQQLALAVRGQRFIEGEWKVDVDGRKLDLAALATLTVREVQAPAFSVKLRDGREMRITPDRKQVARYVVTGEYFEQDVRRALEKFSGPDAGKLYVLSGILVPGTLPHLTELLEEGGRHISLGEPLENFARLELRLPTP